LIAQWRRSGAAPDEPRPDLKRDVRPELDRLQEELVRELAATRALREDPEGATMLATAVAAYAKERGLDTLSVIALDRALARVCER
jgi:chorismate mutase